MKKNIFLLLLMILFVLPMTVSALPSEYSSYKTMNLDEALTQEKIEHDFSDYKETDDQITIYLFRGNGCGYCRNFLTFLNSIIDDYGQYFKVVSFEVWYDKNNVNLMSDVASALNTTASGVPFIIIGKNVFPGYNDDYSEQIKQAIVDEYKSSERYDIFEDMLKIANEDKNKEEKKDSNSTLVIILFNLLFVVVATLVIIGVTTSKQNEILDALDELEEKLTVNSSNK